MASGHVPSGKIPQDYLTMSFDMVTVRVGEVDAAVNIPVYRDQLSAVSPYFRGAFEGSFKEATDRNLPMTDVSEQTFRMFLQWMNVQISSQPGGASKPASNALVEKPTTKSEDKISTMPSIDEEGYHGDLPNGKQMDRLFWKDLEPEDNYQLMLASFLRLYVFADKYDIPRLREDILTALVTHLHIWKWCCDPCRDLIEFAYANLPQSSKFIRFLVFSAVNFWDLTCEDAAKRLYQLKEMHQDFAFDVAVMKVERYTDSAFVKAKGNGYRWWQETLPHSCILHEHLIHDKQPCRKRIRDHPYIFTTLIDACVQDVLGMKERCDEA